MAANTTTIFVEGKLIWRRIFEDDNRANSGKATHAIETTSTTEFEFATFTTEVNNIAQKKANEAKVGSSVTHKYSVLSAKLTSEFKDSDEVSSFVTKSSDQRITEKNIKTVTVKRGWEIDPGVKLVVYQRRLIGPGIAYDLQEYCTGDSGKAGDIKVYFAVNVEAIPEPVKAPSRYVKDLMLHWGDHADMPGNGLQEIHGRDTNINFGFEDKQAGWLYATMTDNPSEAATFFSMLEKEGESDRGYGSTYKDGKIRYRVIEPQQHATQKITSVKLWRSRYHLNANNHTKETSFTIGPDLNRGRGGTYLYLVFYH